MRISWIDAFKIFLSFFAALLNAFFEDFFELDFLTLFVAFLAAFFDPVVFLDPDDEDFLPDFFDDFVDCWSASNSTSSDWASSEKSSSLYL